MSRSRSRASTSPRSKRIRVIVRAATAADREAIDAVESQAFGRFEEALLVGRIEESAGWVNGPSMVAESGGNVVGHILLSHVHVVTPDGAREILALGPLAVLPSHQLRGFGKALVEAGLRRADELGEPVVVLLGSPAYYSRFGFVPAEQLGLEPPTGFPPEHYQARALSACDPRLRGPVVYGHAWDAVANLGPPP